MGKHVVGKHVVGKYGATTVGNLDEKRQSLEQLWAAYVEHALEPAAVPAAILASWQRSQAWVSPERAHAPVADPEATLQQWRASLLYAAARPLLADIQRTATAHGFIAGVSDASGKLLYTHSSRSMQRTAERIHFVPGGHWDETSIGTNALAVSLATHQPAEVFSAQHFVQAVHDWVCYAAPIRDPHGRVLGVLDFSTTWDNATDFGLTLASALARGIEAHLWHLAPEPQQAMLQLQVCGSPRVTWAGDTLNLPLRRLELLVLLALHPEGLSLDALHAHLYGDQAVSFSTLKAEISHLRKQLAGAIASRPYRLTCAFELDMVAIDQHLQTGRLQDALWLYRGALLPVSQSPFLRDWRMYLVAALRKALLLRGDSELMWQFVNQHDPEDVDLLLALLEHLPRHDPRIALVRARLERLEAELQA